MPGEPPARERSTIRRLAGAAAAHARGDLATAERLCGTVLEEQPGEPDALQVLGAVRLQQGRLPEAESLLRRSLAARQCVSATANLAVALHRQGRPAEALPLIEQWLGEESGSALGWRTLARVRKATGDFAGAEAAFGELLRIEPGNGENHRELGLLLKQLARYGEALAAFRRAVAVQPERSEGWNSLGVLLHAMAQQDDPDPVAGPMWSEAEACLRRAVALDPASARAETNLGIVLLGRDQYEEGWRRYAARHRLPDPQDVAGAPSWPQWQGEPLLGRSILLWPEQGYGDTVEFVRLAAVLKQRGARQVTLACRKPLVSLLKGAPGVDAVVDVATPIIRHDYWCYLLDVAAHATVTPDSVPVTLPYLHADPALCARWAEQLPAGGLRVGLVWKGAGGNGNDAHRSLPSFETLRPLWSVPGIRFVSLQAERAAHELARCAATQPAIDIGSRLADFGDTAAVLQQLDLLISVDTAPVHVAGALARPCWALLAPHGLDFRWPAGRNQAQWYPGIVRTFRQDRPGDWAGLIRRVTEALHVWAAEKGGALTVATEAGARGLESAVAAYRAGNPAEADRLCRGVLRRNPGDRDAIQLLGAICAMQGADPEAEALLRQAVAMQEEPVALSNLALLLRRSSRDAEAIPLLRRWAQLDPSSRQARQVLARSLKRRAQALFDEALQTRGTLADGSDWPPSAAESHDLFREAAFLAPDDPGPWCDAGTLLQHFGRFEEADEAFAKALAVDPGHVQTRINRGQLQLLLGNLEEGWKLYAARHEVPTSLAPPALPQWRGEPLAGRSILLWFEEGYGDCIQFVRYVPLLKVLGASRVGILCPPPLANLLLTVPGIDEVFTRAGRKDGYACWAYYLDVPMHVGTRLDSIPAKLPYVFATGARSWARRLRAGRLRVGLNWRGAARHPNDARRSLDGVAALKPLWRVPGVEFVSLQKGPGEEDAAHPPAGQPMVDAGSACQQFSDTANVIANLDLVITVDTAVAHLAGAMGKPVWVLVSTPLPDWRWLLGRGDSPWYPGVMRLFRQQRDGDWAPVIERVAEALADLASPGDPGRRLDRALAADAAGDTAHAERILRGLLASHPQEREAKQMLGAILARGGTSDEAERLFRDALAEREEPLVLGNLSLLLRRSGRNDEALALIERWTQLEPASAKAWAALARTLDALGRKDAAEAAFRRCLDVEPAAARVWGDHGLLLKRMGRLAEAAASLERAVAERPQSAALWNDLGSVYHDQALQEPAPGLGPAELPPAGVKAVEAYRRSADAAPDSPDPWCNMAAVLQQFGRFDDSLAALRQALQRAPDHWQATMNLGFIQLLHGDFTNGWRNFAARHTLLAGTALAKPPKLPAWRGEPLAGRSIVLWFEQGYGDCVQFVRYVSLLKAAGASKVGASCPPALSRLLITVPGIDEIMPRATAKPRYDFWTYYLDVPWHLGTQLDTIPAKLPYLYPDQVSVKKWSARLPAAPVRVGLVWRGSALHGNDRNRSLPSLTVLAPLWQVKGVEFVSLQKGPGEEEAASPPPGQPIADIGAQIKEFSDSAAVMASLDLVICVDTAVAHVAGATGRPVWVMLPNLSLDWRWLLGRDDSPWYPGVMKLFRQERPGDWAPVVERIAADLQSFVAQKARKRRR